MPATREFLMASPLQKKPLFVFEMANNHMGSVEHGLRILREVAEVVEPFRDRFDFAFKLQYRDLDTFIHLDYRESNEFKYIKRFSATRLSAQQFRVLKEEMRSLGFLTVCTPFDEASVDLIEQHEFDYIKIASCSLTDWPLLERIVKARQPVIASAAGSSLQDIDNVVSFFEHRNKDFSLMHCVAEYPTSNGNLQLNQIDLFRQRYPQIRVGFSTHERPDYTEPVRLAVAKGASIFEKHVGVPTSEFGLNDYSATPAQVRAWLQAAAEAYQLCGAPTGRSPFMEQEVASLHSLRRGVFARRAIRAGEKVTLDDVFLAMPTRGGQLTANDFSKYAEFYAEAAVELNQPIYWKSTRCVDHRPRVYKILQRVKRLLKQSHAAVPRQVDFEISHHYGIERFEEYGAVIINFVNREYCKKLIVMLPGQEHPEQHHLVKEETFQILHGKIDLRLDGEERSCSAGEIVTIQRGTKHAFRSKAGALVEEISSKHYPEDSYYSDPAIAQNKRRKTLVTAWVD
jgi:sialic acid synthase SpsE/quercetin dioxygenase-like cupin family protein